MDPSTNHNSDNHPISEKEFTKLVNELNIKLYRFVLKVARDEELARDIVQDSFVKLWTNRNLVNPLKAKSWLFTTSYHGILQYFKRNKRFIEFELGKHDGVGSSDQIQIENKDLIDYSLGELSGIQRSIVVLRDLEGYNYQEIGLMLDLNESQVKVYLFRAREKVAKIVKKNAGNGG